MSSTSNNQDSSAAPRNPPTIPDNDATPHSSPASNEIENDPYLRLADAAVTTLIENRVEEVLAGEYTPTSLNVQNPTLLIMLNGKAVDDCLSIIASSFSDVVWQHLKGGGQISDVMADFHLDSWDHPGVTNAWAWIKIN